MRLKHFYLALNLFLTAGAWAQIGIKTLKSEVFTDAFRKSEIVLAQDDHNGGLLVVRSYESGGLSSSRGYYIEKYDRNLKLLKNKDLSMDSDNAEKFRMVVSVFTTQDEALHLLDICYDLNQKAYVCHDTRITQDFSQTRKMLFTYTREEMGTYGDFALRDLFFSGSRQFWSNNQYNGTFFYPWSGGDFFSNKSPMDGNYVSSGISVAMADDQKTFAVSLDLSGKTETLKTMLFDQGGTMLFSQYFTPEIKDRKFHYQSLLVGPDGQSVFLLGKAYTEKSRKKESGGRYEYVFTKFDANGQQSSSFDTDVHFVTSLKMIQNNGQLSCIGFYSDQKDNRYKGVLFFETDLSTLAVSNVHYNPFTPQFMADKYGDKKQKELKYLSFRKVFATASGDLIFNAEEAYSATTYSGGMGGMGGAGVGVGVGGGSYTSYNYDDIVSGRVDKTGHLVWARNINKSQYSSSDDDKYMGYTSVINGDENYFFINTADDVRTLSGNRIEFKDVRKNRANLVAIRVAPDGAFTYEEVVSNENTSMPFMVSSSVTVGKEVFLLGRKGREKQLLKMTLP